MPRPSQSKERREEFLPIIAGTFAELGYRRTTTAVLARRCGVRENILYRLWPDKKAMFVAAIEHLYRLSEQNWLALVRDTDGKESSAERLLAYETEHYGEVALYRIIFAGLSETDDPAIRQALRDMYARYHRFLQRQIGAHREQRCLPAAFDADLAAWAIVGLGTVSDIGQELGLISAQKRKRLIARTGRLLLEGKADADDPRGSR